MLRLRFTRLPRFICFAVEIVLLSPLINFNYQKMRGGLAALALLATSLDACAPAIHETSRQGEAEIRRVECDPEGVGIDVNARCRASRAMGVAQDSAESADSEISLAQAKLTLEKLNAGLQKLRKMGLTGSFVFGEGKGVKTVELSESVKFQDGDHYYSMFGGSSKDFSSFTVEKLAGNPFEEGVPFVPSVDHSKVVWTAEGRDFEITLTIDGERVASIIVIDDTVISTNNSQALAAFVDRFMANLSANAGQRRREAIRSF